MYVFIFLSKSLTKNLWSTILPIKWAKNIIKHKNSEPQKILKILHNNDHDDLKLVLYLLWVRNLWYDRYNGDNKCVHVHHNLQLFKIVMCPKLIVVNIVRYHPNLAINTEACYVLTSCSVGGSQMSHFLRMPLSHIELSWSRFGFHSGNN